MGKEMSIYTTVLLSIFVIIALIVSLFLIPSLKDVFYPEGSSANRIPGDDSTVDSSQTSAGVNLDIQNNYGNDIDSTYDNYGTYEYDTNDTDDSDNDSETINPNSKGGCTPTTCNDSCVKYDFYEGKCMDNVCYCLYAPPDPGSNLKSEEIPDPNTITFYCRTYGDFQTKNVGAVVYTEETELVKDFLNYCGNSEAIKRYKCDIYEKTIQIGASIVAESMVSTYDYFCTDLICGSYFSEGCLNGQCACVSDISEEFLNYAITSHLMEPNSEITKAHLSILMHAYENQLKEEDIPSLEEAIEVVENQIYDEEGNLKLNYDLMN